ncbi:MAG: hypothetical protein IPK97_04325 [Ahniella sp.]|nr:hypothetical protein [Ahniella sp.]
MGKKGLADWANLAEHSGPGAPHSLRRRLVMTTLAIAMVQFFYWFGLHNWLFKAGERPQTLPTRDFAVASIAAPTLAALKEATYKPVTLPHTECCDTGYRALRFYVDLPEVPAQGLDVIPLMGNDNLMIVLNGLILRLDGRIELDRITYHGNNRTITLAPAGVLRQGENEFVLVVARSVVPYFDMSRPVIGAHEEIRPKVAKRAWLLDGYRDQAIAVGLVISLLALVLLLRSNHRAYALWLFLLVAIWTTRDIYFRWVDPPISPQWRLWTYFALTTALPVAWLNFANVWTGRPWSWLAPVSGLAWLTAAGAFGYLIVLRSENGYDASSSLSNVFGIVMGAFALVRFLWHLLRVPDQRYWEVALFLLLITLMGMEFLWQWMWSISTGNVTNTLPILLIAFVAAFLSRNVRLFRSMNDINALLKEQLAAREKELAEQYARQGELLRRETLLEERRRLMGEMHDGIGGQLVSLMHANRHKAMSAPELNEALTAVAEELRLVIDSLDTVGSSVGTALANYRRRIEPRLKAAGITLRWSNELDTDTPGQGPREVLHVCRIVQEAVTNALKHSGCTEIQLALSEDPDSRRLKIRMADNGRGLPPATEPGSGHGQRSMRERAEALGGTLAVTSDSNGTEVVLEVPLTGL